MNVNLNTAHSTNSLSLPTSTIPSLSTVVNTNRTNGHPNLSSKNNGAYLGGSVSTSNEGNNIFRRRGSSGGHGGGKGGKSSGKGRSTSHGTNGGGGNRSGSSSDAPKYSAYGWQHIVFAGAVTAATVLSTY